MRLSSLVWLSYSILENEFRWYNKLFSSTMLFMLSAVLHLVAGRSVPSISSRSPSILDTDFVFPRHLQLPSLPPSGPDNLQISGFLRLFSFTSTSLTAPLYS